MKIPYFSIALSSIRPCWWQSMAKIVVIIHCMSILKMSIKWLGLLEFCGLSYIIFCPTLPSPCSFHQPAVQPLLLSSSWHSLAPSCTKFCRMCHQMILPLHQYPPYHAHQSSVVLHCPAQGLGVINMFINAHANKPLFLSLTKLFET